jgi:hexosaminidase
LIEGRYTANFQFPGIEIRYSLDGKDPDLKSPLYKDPVDAGGKILKFRAFNTNGRGGVVAETSAE